MRAAALPPLAAFVVAVLYLAVYPLFGSVPALLFWLVVAILFAGAALGLFRILRATSRRVLFWLVAAVVMELVCVRVLVGMVLPWL